MKYLLILSISFLLCSCQKPLKFQYGDVVSFKETSTEFQFRHCSDVLGTITAYRQTESIFFENYYYVDTGYGCAFWSKESNLTKEGISGL